ncbi:MAG TPA: hypothetical protein VMV95_04225 [Bacillota bacterium]|nr:hypothetical protein [Bacillota bacterium]
MYWKKWVDWKEKKYVAIFLFIIAYILTIPLRNYDSFFDISQGVKIWMHLIMIIVGVIVILILLKIIELIIKHFLKK